MSGVKLNGSNTTIISINTMESDVPPKPPNSFAVGGTMELKLRNGEFLVDRRQNTLAWRDFRTEVRGRLDVEHLLNDSVVVLDVVDSDLSAILKRMVEALQNRPIGDGEMRNSSKINKQQTGENRIFYEEINRQLFTLEDVGHFQVTNIRHRLQNVIVDEEGVREDQSWFVLYSTSSSDVTAGGSRVAFARLRTPTNFGDSLNDVQFIVLVVTPSNQKNTKSALETARTFATLIAQPTLRNRLSKAVNAHEFRAAVVRCAERLGRDGLPSAGAERADRREKFEQSTHRWRPFRCVVDDVRRRAAHYASDYWDGVVDARARQKTLSSAVFLYFSILPTAIALGMLNEANTRGKINVNKEILSQWIGGLFFGIFGGQLFLIMLSTAPISIYIQVVQEIADQSGEDFFKLYTTVGLWCTFYLVCFAVLQASIVMRFARRSLEELFGLFISLALVYEAVKAVVDVFRVYRPTATVCQSMALSLAAGNSEEGPLECERAVAPTFLVLLLGTVWLSVSLYEFRKTPYLNRAKRELLSDYALPFSVVAMAVVANVVFDDVPKETFAYNPSATVVELTAFWRMSTRSHLLCAALGFPLAVLFFMDQMIVTNTVDNTQNNLKKGAAANWDLLVVAVMNAGLSLLGLPWMHGALPQAFLHLKSQADVEDRLVDGTVQQTIVRNRESRVATLLAHTAMIPTYFFLLPYIHLVPTCIFHGLFVYLAYTSTIGNEFCQRMALLFTEQRAYPPSHYNRRVPQRIVHAFTLIELLQLVVLFGVGFAPSPAIQLTFPLITFLFIPFRSLLLPRLIDRKYLETLDDIH